MDEFLFVECCVTLAIGIIVCILCYNKAKSKGRKNPKLFGFFGFMLGWFGFFLFGYLCFTEKRVTCPDCKASIPATAKVCMHCGCKIQETIAKQKAVEAAKPKFKCAYCGKEVPDDSEVCPHCGCSGKVLVGTNVEIDTSEPLFNDSVAVGLSRPLPKKETLPDSDYEVIGMSKVVKQDTSDKGKSGEQAVKKNRVINVLSWAFVVWLALFILFPEFDLDFILWEELVFPMAAAIWFLFIPRLSYDWAAKSGNFSPILAAGIPCIVGIIVLVPFSIFFESLVFETGLKVKYFPEEILGFTAVYVGILAWWCKKQLDN